MRVIGTAGHVDHGKSTLVEALTGTHPDRLKEEREREMTIDLGFAWFTLPNGEELGIVDVPGHRDFIENMLAGVGGIDTSLFVVAADEGVMPQTREHLSILDILQVQGGVVALTKIDMVEDEEWLDLVEEEIREMLVGTVLESAPIVRVSAKEGVGIDELQTLLEKSLENSSPRVDLGRPRLPIDRIFTISGFGTVVTGTLTDGALRIGDEVEVLPSMVKGRIRGLQTHKRKEEVAVPGSRTAVNISGVSVEQIKRGDVIVHPGDYRPTGRLDVTFRLLPDLSMVIKHNMEVKLFIGAAEVVARIRLLGVDELKPGETGWLQLELKQKVVAVRGDRYILRRPSPGETLGGGVIVDPHPLRRYKRYSADILSRLESLKKGTPDEILYQALKILGAASLKEAIIRSNLDDDEVRQAIDPLLESGRIVPLTPESASGGRLLPTDLVINIDYLRQLHSQADMELSNYHQTYPLRSGMPRQELKSRLKISPKLFNALLVRWVAQGAIGEHGPFLFQPDHEILFSPEQEDAIASLQRRFVAAPYAPPSVKECQAELGEEVYAALLSSGELVQVSAEVVFSRQGYQQMVAEVRGMIEREGQIKASQVRDRFQTSRKYVLALLEHLDDIGITIRVGDVRRLRN
jgi:selenocysteine-specific elongation factor